MSRSFHDQPTSTLDHLDRQLRELPREHGKILNLDAFRRHLEHASDPRHALLVDTQTADADAQLRHELSLAFADLGGAAFALTHHGALKDSRLAPHVQRIHGLYAQLDSLAHNPSVSRPDHSALGDQVTTA
jgi:hypothetical protein